MKLVSVSEMQAVEREADSTGYTYAQMMEQAGNNLAAAVVDRYRPLLPSGILGLVGSGNNGGDTLVALAELAARGWKTAAALLRPRPESDPLVARLHDAGGEVITLYENADYTQYAIFLPQYRIWLDGILGTGFRLPLKADLAQLMSAIHEICETAHPRPIVVAVDCPSGIDCDTGEAAPHCLRADLTVTMAAIKQGLLKFPAYDYVGDLQLAGIGLPKGGETMQSWQAIHRTVLDKSLVRTMLPVRKLDAHKGTFGTSLIVAGSISYTGAVLLAGEAAYRIGTGLVTLAVPASIQGMLAGHLVEATWIALEEEKGSISQDAADQIFQNLDRPTAMLVGPGLGLSESTTRFMSRLLDANPATGLGFISNPNPSHPKVPGMVLDADGLKHLSRLADWHEHLPPDSILTPHPGEMSVLTGLSTSIIQADRLRIAEQYAQEWQVILVLKGAFTVIAAPDGRTALVPVATPALARAGTGDVLAGLIVGLRAQGVPGFEAACAGAWIHAQAGLFAAQQAGTTAVVLASDVVLSVKDILREMEI
jgi:ADP-dependent NAD(P)H-hydrate dehydratase / NAD(P)H-hydrate epimerase